MHEKRISSMLGLNKKYLCCLSIVIFLCGISIYNYHSVYDITDNVEKGILFDTTFENSDESITWDRYSVNTDHRADLSIDGLISDSNGNIGAYVVLDLPPSTGYLESLSRYYPGTPVRIYRSYMPCGGGSGGYTNRYIADKNVSWSDHTYFDYVTQNGTYYYCITYDAYIHHFTSIVQSINVTIYYGLIETPELTTSIPYSSEWGYYHIRWDEIEYATFYLVYRSLSSDPSSLGSPTRVYTNSINGFFKDHGTYYYFIQASNWLVNSLLSDPIKIVFDDDDTTVDITNFTCSVTNELIMFIYTDIDQSGGISCPQNMILNQIPINIGKDGVKWTNINRIHIISIPNFLGSPLSSQYTFKMCLSDRDNELGLKDHAYAEYKIIFGCSKEALIQELNSTMKDFMNFVNNSNDEVWNNPNHKKSAQNKLEELVTMVFDPNSTYAEVMSKIDNDLRKHLNYRESSDNSGIPESKNGNGPGWIVDGIFANLCDTKLNRISELCEKVLNRNLANDNCIISISVKQYSNI